MVYDGEQQRSEMYAWAVAHANGFDWRGSVRAFDNKYYSKAAVTGPISLREPYHNDEFAFLQDVAQADAEGARSPARTPSPTGRFDEHYVTDTRPGPRAEERQAGAARRPAASSSWTSPAT